MVVVEVEERSEHRLPLVRLASGIEADWLLDLFLNGCAKSRSWSGTERTRGVEAVQHFAV